MSFSLCGNLNLLLKFDLFVGAWLWTGCPFISHCSVLEWTNYSERQQSGFWSAQHPPSIVGIKYKPSREDEGGLSSLLFPQSSQTCIWRERDEGGRRGVGENGGYPKYGRGQQIRREFTKVKHHNILCNNAFSLGFHVARQSIRSMEGIKLPQINLIYGFSHATWQEVYKWCKYHTKEEKELFRTGIFNVAQCALRI